MNISDSTFEDNTVKGGGVIFNREGSNLNVSKTTEFREEYPENEIVDIR